MPTPTIPLLAYPLCHTRPLQRLIPQGMERLPGEEEGPHAGQLLLLKGITGSFRPGVLTALMGASGAGKTVRGPHCRLLR